MFGLILPVAQMFGAAAASLFVVRGSVRAADKLIQGDPFAAVGCAVDGLLAAPSLLIGQVKGLIHDVEDAGNTILQVGYGNRKVLSNDNSNGNGNGKRHKAESSCS